MDHEPGRHIMRVLQSTHHAVANHGGNRTHIVYAPVAHGFESQRFAVAFEWVTGNHLTEAVDSTLTPQWIILMDTRTCCGACAAKKK